MKWETSNKYPMDSEIIILQYDDNTVNVGAYFILNNNAGSGWHEQDNDNLFHCILKKRLIMWRKITKTESKEFKLAKTIKLNNRWVPNWTHIKIKNNEKEI